MILKKTSLYIILTTTLLFSQQLEDYAKFNKITPKIKQEMKRFDHMKRMQYKNKAFNKEKFSHMKKHTESDLDKDIKNSVMFYTGDDYMTKDEYKYITKKVLKARKDLKTNLASEYILYLTSETVPNNALFNILHSVGILQENGVHIRSKQYLIGPPKDFENYMLDKKSFIDAKTEKEQLKIYDNFHLKIDPRMFDMFKIKKVPAIVLAYCTAKNPTKKTCKFKYLIRGDGSLTNFFDKISEKDPKYKKYYEYLIANKLIHDQNNEAENE